MNHKKFNLEDEVLREELSMQSVAEDSSAYNCSGCSCSDAEAVATVEEVPADCVETL
jgi:hypothetical protein